MAVLGIGLLARTIGDGVPALGWLHWLSPFGLLALSGPYVEDGARPLLLLAVAVVLVAAVAVIAAGHRDVQGGLLPAAAGRVFAC